MRGLNGPRQRDNQLGRRASRLRRARQASIEVPSLEELERHERNVAEFADIVDLQDMGMTEPRDGLGLDAKAGQMIVPEPGCRR